MGRFVHGLGRVGWGEWARMSGNWVREENGTSLFGVLTGKGVGSGPGTIDVHTMFNGAEFEEKLSPLQMLRRI